MPRAAAFPQRPGRRRRHNELFGAGAHHAVVDVAPRDTVSFFTLGEKRVSGVPTGEPALIAYVSWKGETDEDQRIPATVTVALPEGSRTLATDVVELPSLPTMLGMRAGHLIRAADSDFGVCSLCFRRGSENYALTNAHVVANMATGMFPGEPRVQDPNSLALRRIGETIYVSPFAQGNANDEDIAVIRADQVTVDLLGISGEARPLAAIAGFSGSSASRYWYKVNGVKISCGSPEPLVGNARLSMDGRNFLFTRFWNLQVLQGIAAPGHSGALICSGSGSDIVAHGLLFAGSPPSFVFAFPIDEMLRRAEAQLADRGL